jgi:RNA-directed DNA polymerase
VRYADDFGIICRTKREAQEAVRTVKQIMSRLKLILHPSKTRLGDKGREGFDFLGFPFHTMQSKKPHKLLPSLWPGPKAMKAVRRKIRDITTRKRLRNPLTEVIKYLHRVIRGWRNYFRIGNSPRKLQQLDRDVRQRLRQWMRSQRGSRGHWSERAWETLIAQSGLEYFYRSGICVVRPGKPSEEGCRKAV